MTASSTPPLHVLRGILRHVKSTPAHASAVAAPLKSATPAASASTSGSSASATAAPGWGRTSGEDLSELTLREHVLAQYRKNASAPPKRVVMLRQLAYDMLELKNDLKERARLHELDGGAEVKLSPAEMTRRAAARAGLYVPKVGGGDS